MKTIKIKIDNNGGITIKEGCFGSPTYYTGYTVPEAVEAFLIQPHGEKG